MKKKLSILLWLFFLTACATSAAVRSTTFQDAVSQWTSYKDVADWMRGNFHYAARKTGGMWQPRSPEEIFRSGTGMCQDGSNFARVALNRINPNYKARIVYIENRVGPPHHWVTAFTMDGKIYVIDYAAGAGWASMMGVHGPYDSLKEYESFLSSLRMNHFELGRVEETSD